jgi:hypothetical protein
MRKFFGWLFGIVAVMWLAISILICSGLVKTGILHRQNSRGSIAALIIFFAFVCMTAVFAMAWWTTWKSRSTARAWGIAASLIQLSLPLSLIYFRHLKLSNGKWQMMVLSTLALIAYAWPDSETKPDTEKQLDHPE